MTPLPYTRWALGNARINAGESGASSLNPSSVSHTPHMSVLPPIGMVEIPYILFYQYFHAFLKRFLRVSWGIVCSILANMQCPGRGFWGGQRGDRQLRPIYCEWSLYEALWRHPNTMNWLVLCLVSRTNKFQNRQWYVIRIYYISYLTSLPQKYMFQVLPYYAHGLWRGR